MLGFLKRVGKGFATITGLGATAAGGAVLLSVDSSVNQALTQVAEIITALGVLLASFGIGRKAGAA